MSKASQEEKIVTQEVASECVSQTSENIQSEKTQVVPEYYKSRKDNKFASVDGLFNKKS